MSHSYSIRSICQSAEPGVAPQGLKVSSSQGTHQMVDVYKGHASCLYLPTSICTFDPLWFWLNLSKFRRKPLRDPRKARTLIPARVQANVQVALFTLHWPPFSSLGVCKYDCMRAKKLKSILPLLRVSTSPSLSSTINLHCSMIPTT